MRVKPDRERIERAVRVAIDRRLHITPRGHGGVWSEIARLYGTSRQRVHQIAHRELAKRASA